MITVTLTQEEIATRSQSLAQYANKLADLADEEERVKADYKSTMADIKERRLDISSELRRLSRAVRLGVEERTTQQVLFEEEQRLAEARKEQEAEEPQGKGKEAVAEFFGGNEETREWSEAAGSFIAENDVEDDDFTAPICDECKRIDGGHTQKCSRSDALTFEDYLAYAHAHYKRNHQSHARKMELSKTSDDKVREWMRRQVDNGSGEKESGGG